MKIKELKEILKEFSEDDKDILVWTDKESVVYRRFYKIVDWGRSPNGTLELHGKEHIQSISKELFYYYRHIKDLSTYPIINLKNLQIITGEDGTPLLNLDNVVWENMIKVVELCKSIRKQLEEELTVLRVDLKK